MDKINQLRDIIACSNYMVFFGGAGTSTESNIPDFRSESGLYNAINKYKCSPEQIISFDFFVSNTEDFYRYYKENLIHADAKPNDAHIALVELEKKGILKSVITQNIDGLHQKAGSKEVIELHGTAHKNTCIKCSKKYDINYIINSKNIPLCNVCKGLVKPDVILYGEGLDDDVLKKAVSRIRRADTLIVGGTSLVVYPAAGLLEFFKGKNLVLINESKTQYDGIADLVINQKIGEVLKKAIKNEFK